MEQPFDDDKIMWWMSFIMTSLLSFISRLYKISEPEHVCWDETHFGKMGSWYINRTFFFDVHPPLGKMLIGLSGYMSGYEGNFSFSKPGEEYGDTPYIGMRVVCAVLGGMLVPLCFCSVWEMSQSVMAAVFASCLIIFDTGVLTLSQYILLDPYLMFFIMAATYSHLKFISHKQREFEKPWWCWLIITGIFLACAISTKFVGLFVVLLIGVFTVLELWKIMGDLSLPMVSIAAHFLARAVCLIFLPVVMYGVFFMIHFHILSRSGSGDGFFSSAFQSQLIGNKLHNSSMPEDLAYGSVVTLKNFRSGGAYLHSHWHLYPEGVGARQQQVTTYSHKDENNMWRVKRYDRNPALSDPVELVKSGDFIRLEHVPTKRNLHSHRHNAPITRRHHQVTCYGENGTGDANDVFQLVVQDAAVQAPVKRVTSTFSLLHLNTGCALHSHNKQLPKWGWDQLEVTCNPYIKDKKNLWNIEEIIDDRLPNKTFELYAPSFLEKFIESHVAMIQGNSGLKPKEGEVTSRPWQWPINYRGQPFSGKDYRVYLLGNPVLWWSILPFLAAYLILSVYFSVKWQRGCREEGHQQVLTERCIYGCSCFFLGWLLHYIPFWTMGRVLYFHHYFPSYLYSCMLTGIIIDFILVKLTLCFSEESAWIVYHTCVAVIISGITYSFYLFSPLSYGLHGPPAANISSPMHKLWWLHTWDF